MSTFFDVVKQFQNKPIEKVSESERLRRVRICDGCPHLKFGTNCGICFCFVSDKASYKHDNCPDVSAEFPNGRWNERQEIQS